MGTSAIAHLKNDFDRYVVELRRISNLAATFILKDTMVKWDYQRETEKAIREYQRKFYGSLHPGVKTAVINELKKDLEVTSREYQRLRRGDYIKYMVTDIFEDKGVLKYIKIGGGVALGAGQIISGVYIFSLSRRFNLRRYSVYGSTLIAHGTNNLYESLSPLLFKHQESGPLRELYRQGARIIGCDNSAGDFAYSAIDFSFTAYSAIGMPVIRNSPARLVSRSFLEKPGTGRLFRFTSKDHVRKWDTKIAPLKIYQAASTGYKFKTTFLDGNFNYP